MDKKKRSAPKPQWGWRQEFTDRKITDHFSDADIAHCAKILGISFAENKNKIYDGIDFAFCVYWMETEQSVPSIPEIKSALSEIQKSNKSLLEKLDNIDEASRNILLEEISDISPDLDRDILSKKDRSNSLPSYNQQAAFRYFIEFSKSIESACEKLTKGELQSFKGRPKNRALSNFIAILRDFYADTTKTDPSVKTTIDSKTGEYWSPFISFVEFCLDRTHPDHGLSNGAIGEAVRRNIGSR